jgi:pimeloyl-ACP methyl ester carboxylesterase
MTPMTIRVIRGRNFPQEGETHMIRITLIIITLITLLPLAASREAKTRATAGLSVSPLTAPLAPKQVEIFGQKINYIDAGSGPNLILLHGLGDDLNVWEQTVPALAPKYRVWALDQIGFGVSDKPFINYRVSVLVEFLHAFCKKLGVEKATLVGNSLGGWVAAAFASAYPDRVEKLVLVGAAGYWPKHLGVQELTREQLMKLSASSPSAYKETLKWMLYDETFLTDDFVEQAYAAQLKRNDGYTITEFIESILLSEDRLDGKMKRIRASTLVVWGREDEVTPFAIGEAFAMEIPGAQLSAIDRCGHMPQWECAGALNAALLKFLTGDSTAREF